MKAGAYDPKRYDVGTDSPDSPDISSNDDDSSPPPRTVKLLPRAPRAAGAAVATTAQPQPPMHNSAHPDYAAAATIRGNTGNTVSTKTLYATDWAVFTRFCVKYNWDPCSFSLELAELFAGHISNRTPPPAKITPYFTAMNDHYVHHRPSLGRPWAGGLMTELRKGYETTIAIKAQQTGRRLGSLRVAVPQSAVKLLLTKSESYVRALDGDGNPDTGTNLVWCAVFWLQLLFGFRADTIGGINDASDVRVNADNSISFTVRRVKRQSVGTTGVLRPFVRHIPAPRPGSLRFRVHSVIAAAKSVQMADGSPLLGPNLIDQPSKAADKISKAMDTILPSSELADVVGGTFISSHSWRKTGACTLSLFCSSFTVKRWGMWKSLASVDSYVDDGYEDPADWLRSLFDWLNPSSADQPTPNWGGWAGYDGPQDDADDGITAD